MYQLIEYPCGINFLSLYKNMIMERTKKNDSMSHSKEKRGNSGKQSSSKSNSNNKSNNRQGKKDTSMKQEGRNSER
jgi:hypothetical protein